MLVRFAVREGSGHGDTHVDADVRPLVGIGLDLQGLNTEGDVPAERVLDQSCPGDPVVGIGTLADRKAFGPPEADPAHLGNVDHAPAAVHAGDVQVAALRNVHGHHRAEPALEVRGVGAALPAVLPRPEVRLEYRLRGLGREGGQEVDVLAGLSDRGVRVRKSPHFLRHHPPPRVEKIPHRAGRVRLIIRRANPGRKQREPGTVPELPLDQGVLTHDREHSIGLCHRAGILIPTYAPDVTSSTTCMFIWFSSRSTGVLVRFLLRRIMRRGTPDRRQAVHRKPAASRLTVTPEPQSTPALRASRPRMTSTPVLKGGALAKIRGRPQNRLRPTAIRLPRANRRLSHRLKAALFRPS